MWKCREIKAHRVGAIHVRNHKPDPLVDVAVGLANDARDLAFIDEKGAAYWPVRAC